MSLSKLTFLNTLLTALFFTVVIGVFTVKLTYDSYETRVQYMEQNYIQKNKELIQHEVERSIQRASLIDREILRDMHNTLKEKVKTISLFLTQKGTGIADKEAFVRQYRQKLNQMKWDEGSGYLFVFDALGVIWYHGHNPEYEGMNIKQLAAGDAEILKLFQDVLKEDEHSGTYFWSKPQEKKNHRFEKYISVRRIPNSDMYVAAGVYKDDVRKKVFETIFGDLRQERFGDTGYGYFWVTDMHYKMLMHPISPELEKVELSDYQGPDGKYLFKTLHETMKKQGGGFIEYAWYRPDNMKVDDKITYARLHEELGIVIASGFYLTKLKELLEDEKSHLREMLIRNLEKIIVTLIILIGVSLIAARYLALRINVIEEERKKHLNMLEQYKMVLDQSNIVSKTDPSGKITYVNQAFCHISEFEENELLGKPHSIVRHPQTPKRQFKELWQTIRQGNMWSGLIKNRSKSGKSYFNNTVIVPIRDTEGNISEYISASMDITELIEHKSKLENILHTDALTGLGNRVSLISKLAANKGGVLGLLNVNSFKEVNDSLGQTCGDNTIRSLANRLFDFISDNKAYSLYRIQADEFALYSATDSEEAMVENIKNFMTWPGAQPYGCTELQCQDRSIILTYSAGIAKGDENILAYADIALSEAKKKKQKILVYEPGGSNIENFSENIIWVEKIHKAIKEDRIVPFYQPIYSYRTGSIDKYECLMRLMDEEGQPVSPFHFLEVAKKTKLYPDLSYSMITKSIDRFASLTSAFSINLSPEDLMNAELMEYFYDYTVQKEVVNQLVLEIIESEEIENYDEITKTILRFKDMGVKIAIDDFGSGYSNYDYLVSLQADFIKLDGSLIKHIVEDERTQEVVRSIVTFARKSNMQTIAEFVSSKEVSDKVQMLGVDYAQGYFYGKPLADPLDR